MTRLLFVGDIHGRFKQMYDLAESLNADRIIQVGDIETVANQEDLENLKCPQAYRQIREFGIYDKLGKVPIRTDFIHGNHEAFNRLKDQSGQEILENLYYLGRTNQIQIAGKKIGTLSGIYSRHNTKLNKKINKYYDFDDLDQFQSKLDILVLHDWPFRFNTAKKKIDFEYREMNDLIDRTKPELIVAGHVHYPIQTDFRGSKFVGLNFIGRNGDHYILDI